MSQAKPDRTECFTTGVDARAAGRPASTNPYPPRSPQHEEWSAGWHATYDLDEDDDPLSTRLKEQDEDPDAEGGPAPR